MKRKALFLDRDGVINKDFGYVCEVERLEYVDGIFDLCRKAKSKGYLIIVITNQAGIGRGYYSEKQFLDFMDIIKANFIEEDCQIDAVYYCPHHPTAGIGEYRMNCKSRKPNNGMILQADKDFSIDQENSILVGDKPSDIQAGVDSGIKNLYLFTSNKVSAVNLSQSMQLSDIPIN
jgi:D-glycero-D-manno-heptose 1,7-bisphosphate phosphatase